MSRCDRPQGCNHNGYSVRLRFPNSLELPCYVVVFVYFLVFLTPHPRVVRVCVIYEQILFIFFFTRTTSGLLVWITLSVCMLKFSSFSLTVSTMCHAPVQCRCYSVVPSLSFGFLLCHLDISTEQMMVMMIKGFHRCSTFILFRVFVISCGKCSFKTKIFGPNLNPQPKLRKQVWKQLPLLRNGGHFTRHHTNILIVLLSHNNR